MTTEVERLEDEATDIWLVGLVGLVGRKGLVSLGLTSTLAKTPNSIFFLT